MQVTSGAIAAGCPCFCFNTSLSASQPLSQCPNCKSCSGLRVLLDASKEFLLASPSVPKSSYEVSVIKRSRRKTGSSALDNESGRMARSPAGQLSAACSFP